MILRHLFEVVWPHYHENGCQYVNRIRSRKQVIETCNNVTDSMLATYISDGPPIKISYQRYPSHFPFFLWNTPGALRATQMFIFFLLQKKLNCITKKKHLQIKFFLVTAQVIYLLIGDSKEVLHVTLWWAFNDIAISIWSCLKLTPV